VPFTEAIRIAFHSLRANKLRSFLTVLGILIGVSSVIAVVAITEGLDRYISDQVLDLGSKSFRLQKAPDIITSHEEWQEVMKRKLLDLRDLEAVKASCTLCTEVGALVGTSGSVKRGRELAKGVRIMGITENISRIGAVRDLEQGRQLVEQDINQSRRVAVIGPDLIEVLFGSVDPMGKVIDVDGRPLKVVGVTDAKGSVFGASQDNFIWMPITTFRKLYGSRRSITIQAEALSMAEFEPAQDQVRMAMRNRRHLTYRKPDSFAIETGESIMELWQTATRGIYVVTIVVTAISLLIGGIVVMNIMLVSVTERIQEIGIRKAMGARRGDILRQFLVESVVLSGFGGLLGVLGATAISLGLAGVLGNMLGLDFSAPVRPWAVGLALGVSSAVGLVAGLYPANQAAALDPVEALRNEG
jgi:putative ABC transport system permease protein